MALALSIFALLATFYQLYLQRIHNEKSVKPLAQINLTDHDGLIYIRVQNNGLGPLIAERLIFIGNGQEYYDIKDCLSVNPRQYLHVPINASVKKVVSPGAYVEIFSKQFDAKDKGAEMDDLRRQLAALKLKVEGRDIYDNKITVERDLNWFVRHLKNDPSRS